MEVGKGEFNITSVFSFKIWKGQMTANESRLSCWSGNKIPSGARTQQLENCEKAEFEIWLLQYFRLRYSFPAWKSVFLSAWLLDTEYFPNSVHLINDRIFSSIWITKLIVKAGLLFSSGSSGIGYITICTSLEPIPLCINWNLI